MRDTAASQGGGFWDQKPPAPRANTLLLSALSNFQVLVYVCTNEMSRLTEYLPALLRWFQ
eukprot:m.384448 g.384448  ORF g.384448 m.384448 type:complete len:60 (+) comp20991_c2_seq1:653-832(+)